MPVITKVEYGQYYEKLHSLERFAEIAQPILAEGLKDVVQAVAETASELAPRFSGELADSITSRVEPQVGLNVIGHVSSNVEHALYVDKGTHAHTAPIGPLIAWCNGSVEGGWGMRRLIEEHGPFGRKFFKKARQKNERYKFNRMQQAVNQALEKVAGTGK